MNFESILRLKNSFLRVIAHDEEVQWREGKRPDYSFTNKFLHQESKFQHPEDSLEAMSTTGCAYAQNLVRICDRI